MQTTHKVYLVGAGPGDEKLLTIKALECIKKADVILYDRLVNPLILDHAGPDCKKIYTGKMNTEGGKTQISITGQIIDQAKEHKVVVRLKGGDPFLFGRGGEEAEALVENGIPFEIVPGITSALAVPAYAGIPITHRDYSSEVHIFTGHTRNDGLDLDFSKIAPLEGTLVFLMGIKNLSLITTRLLENGKSPTTPCAVIERGTREDQRITQGDLQTITDIASENNVTPPAIIVIGETTRFCERLTWFSQRPLADKKIVITRSRNQSAPFKQQLKDLGASVRELPVISFNDISKEHMTDTFVKTLRDYTTILFNSANGVTYFFKRLHELGYDARILGGLKIGVVGKTTADSIRAYNIIPDIIPASYTVNDLIKSAMNDSQTNDRILIVTSDLSPVDTDALKAEYNREFDKLILYKTVPAPIDEKRLTALLDEAPDVFTFLSSSTVKYFKEIIATYNLMDHPGITNALMASIGPMTSATLRDLGFVPEIEASQYCVDGVIESIVTYYSDKAEHCR